MANEIIGGISATFLYVKWMHVQAPMFNGAYLTIFIDNVAINSVLHVQFLRF